MTPDRQLVASARDRGLVLTTAAPVRWLTERGHLNRIVQDLFREHGGQRIDGESERLNKHVSDLKYSAGLSAPRLTLDDDGTAYVEPITDPDELEDSFDVFVVARTVPISR